MKLVLTTAFVFCFSGAFTQTTSVQPVEQQYHVSYWWWILGVLLAVGAGVVIYMLIKKDPKRDAVR